MWSLNFKIGIYHENVYFSSWKCFKKVFLFFFFFFPPYHFVSSANPCPEGSICPLPTMTASLLLCSVPHSQYLAYFLETFLWGESPEGNVSCSSKQNLLWGLKELLELKIVLLCGHPQTLKLFFAFLQEGDDEKLGIFPPVIFHFEDVFLWILIEKQSTRSQNQAALNSRAALWTTWS